MAEVAAANIVYVMAGYVATGVALGGYVGYLLLRARRARTKTAAIAAGRARSS